MTDRKIENSNELEFAVFCIENVAAKLGVDAEHVYQAFTEKSNILNCRSGNDATDYDIVEGGVANDKVFNTVELFFDGLIDKTEAINRLRYEKPNLQICFRTERALGLLHFEGSEKL